MAFRGSAPPPARRGGPGVPPRAGSPPGRGPSPGRFGGGAPPPVARRGATPPGRGPSPPPPGRGAFPPAVRGSPPSRGPPATRGAPPPRGGSPPTRGPPATRGAPPPAVAPRGGPPAVAPRGGAPAAGARSGGAPLPSGAPEEFAQITAKRINVEGEDDDDDYNMDEFSTRKEDKTMISAKMLKDQEKNAEKFGQAAFNHAKKMLRVEPDKEEELRDDSEWD